MGDGALSVAQGDEHQDRPRVWDPVELGPLDDPPDHPIAAIWLYENDLDLLGYLLQDLRALIRLGARGDVGIQPYRKITWSVHGLQRRTVVCNPAELYQQRDVRIVGFFGDRNPADVDSGIDHVELDLVSQFRNYPGILAYSSTELVDDQWANLVVHESAADREAWRHCPAHRHAVDFVSPRAYLGVRIHNGYLPGGVIGCGSVVLESTKYWDFTTTPTWHARRVLPGGATGTVRRPARPVGN